MHSRFAAFVIGSAGRRWRRLTILGLAVAGLVLTGAVGDTAAYASTGNQVVVNTITMRGCSIQLLATWDGNGNDYAAARGTYVAPPNYNPAEEVVGCEFQLFREHNGSYGPVSGVHDVYYGSETTYNYWDGAGYLCYLHARQIYGDSSGFTRYGDWVNSDGW